MSQQKSTQDYTLIDTYTSDTFSVELRYYDEPTKYSGFYQAPSDWTPTTNIVVIFIYAGNTSYETIYKDGMRAKNVPRLANNPELTSHVPNNNERCFFCSGEKPRYTLKNSTQAVNFEKECFEKLQKIFLHALNDHPIFFVSDTAN